MSELLAAIETTILLEPQNFYKFVEELTIEEESISAAPLSQAEVHMW